MAAKQGHSGAFFKCVKKLSQKCPSPPWDISKMFPGETNATIAETAASYFTKITDEFTPLSHQKLPGSAPPPPLYQMAAKLRHCKKPSSRVEGDIPGKLVTAAADLLAFPLEYIYRTAFAKAKWPAAWKTETVSLIPKNAAPSGLNQVRNLSCTPLFSKVLESFLLDRIKSEIPTAKNQFGGCKGSGPRFQLREL